MNKNKLFGIIGVVVVVIVLGIILKKNGVDMKEQNGTAATGKEYAMAEVVAHNKESDCWATINGGVYDLTAWISAHPGGPEAITSLCGTDGSAAFNEQHGGQGNPEKELASLKIGILATASTGKKIAFNEFIKQGGSYKCEVHQALSDMENSGTVYINGGNISGEYSTIAEGRTMKIFFIMKDGFSYTWGDMMQGMGFKVKVPANASGDAGAGASGTYSWNASQIGDYNCEAWTLDQAKFALPSGVNFQEIKS